jgi:hypothetical protein
MRRTLRLPLFLLGVVVVPVMADVTVGLPPDPNTGNCAPFGCSYRGEYQQVYSASQFSGPITITNLEFFNTQYNSEAYSMNSGTWNISLSITSADWNTLSNTYANNIGPDNTLVFSGNLFQPWAFGDTLSISLSTPFTYNPAMGNLLMDVTANATTPDGFLFISFDTNGANGDSLNGNTFMGRVFCNSSSGLVTEFSTSVSPVPEPSFVYLLGLGLITLAVARKVRLQRSNG